MISWLNMVDYYFYRSIPVPLHNQAMRSHEGRVLHYMMWFIDESVVLITWFERFYVSNSRRTCPQPRKWWKYNWWHKMRIMGDLIVCLLSWVYVYHTIKRDAPLVTVQCIKVPKTTHERNLRDYFDLEKRVHNFWETWSWLVFTSKLLHG